MAVSGLPLDRLPLASHTWTTSSSAMLSRRLRACCCVVTLSVEISSWLYHTLLAGSVAYGEVGFACLLLRLESLALTCFTFSFCLWTIQLAT